MNSEISDLAAWCERQRDEASRQIELFGKGGVKALLQMPDGSTQDITAGVATHQVENVAKFECLAAALKTAPGSGTFERQNLAGTVFTDRAMPGATFDDVNLSGALFTNVNLKGARLTNVNLSGVAIEDANIDGLTIHGIDIDALVQAELLKRRS
jgi:uncharacterized protein YjbI with pentapeptide repeats